jgi:aminopeptidase N
MGPRLGIVLVLGCLTAACGSEDASSPAVPAATVARSASTVSLPTAADEAALLDAVFRVDIETIEAVFDVFPAESRVQAQAAAVFHMRAGQSRPILHFAPAQTAADVALSLDGQALAVDGGRDVHFLTFERSGQTSLELQRDLAAGTSHRLEVSWSFALTDAGRRFFTNVNDIEGRGNEIFFPTLNTPHELARHVLVFRVHGAAPYLAVGSGLVTSRSAPDAQEWVLDTEREVASYTVMFHVAPAASHVLSERRVQGVDVRVLAPSGGVTAEQAFSTLDPWLPELDRALGPFPMPRGLSVVLTQSGGGMEYFGGTTTSLSALQHEVFHMYFGCSTVARTYRDSWWDEAIDMWYARSLDPSFTPIAETFRSGMVNDRTAVAVGFDVRAYQEGAQIFQAVTAELGGRDQMIRFLRHLHESRSFQPFTTWQLADELQAWSGVSFHDRFRSWLYQGPEAAATRTSPYDWLHRVDMTLPR